MSAAATTHSGRWWDTESRPYYRAIRVPERQHCVQVGRMVKRGDGD